MSVNANQRRKLGRTKIAVRDLAGRYQLKFDDRCMEWVTIRDISHQGAGLELNEPVGVDTAVTVTLIAGDWQLAVAGVVIWCRKNLDSVGNPTHEKRYLVGIQFDHGNTHNNVLFYMATRALMGRQTTDMAM